MSAKLLVLIMLMEVSFSRCGSVRKGPPAKAFGRGDVGVVVDGGGEASHVEELGEGDVDVEGVGATPCDEGVGGGSVGVDANGVGEIPLAE